MKRAGDVAALVGVALVIVAVKAVASSGRADAVIWLLAPTARLVGALWGVAFVPEQGVGYVNANVGYVIATACSGLNFLLAAFASLATVLATGDLDARTRWLRLGVAAACAYVATIATNTVRLSIALWIHAHHPNLPLGAADAHRLLGIVLYVAALLALTVWAHRLRTKNAALQPAVLIGIGWYLSITLGLPLLHGRAFEAGFARHALWIFAAAVLAAGFLLAPQAKKVSSWYHLLTYAFAARFSRESPLRRGD
jgi:exosortase K